MPPYLFLLAVLGPCHSLTVTVVSFIRCLILKNYFRYETTANFNILYLYICWGGDVQLIFRFVYILNQWLLWIYFSSLSSFLPDTHFALILASQKNSVNALALSLQSSMIRVSDGLLQVWQGILIWAWGSAWSSELLIAWFYLAPTNWPKIDFNYSVSLLPTGSL